MRPQPAKRKFGPGREFSPDVFHAISDPTRRRLLDLLGDGELTVIRMAAGFRMSRPAVSQHLAILRHARLVTMRCSGREHYYRLRAQRLREVHRWVSHYERFWKEKLTALGQYLNRTAKRESAEDDKKKTARRES